MKVFLTIIFSLNLSINLFAQKIVHERKFHPSLFIIQENSYSGLQLNFAYKFSKRYRIRLNFSTLSTHPPDLPDNYTNIGFRKKIANKLNYNALSLFREIPFSKNNRLFFKPALGIVHIRLNKKFAFEKDFSLLTNSYFFKTEKVYLVGINVETKLEYKLKKQRSIDIILMSQLNLYKNLYGVGIGYTH